MGTEVLERPRKRPPRKQPKPVEDRRCGTPTEQLRKDLERMRAAGLSFDRAWEIAYARIKWPHDTYHRKEWKVIIAVQAPAWRAAYEGRGRRLVSIVLADLEHVA